MRRNLRNASHWLDRFGTASAAEVQCEQLSMEGRIKVFRGACLLSDRFRRRVSLRVPQTIGSSAASGEPRSARASWPPLAHALHQSQPRRRLARLDHRQPHRVRDRRAMMRHPGAAQHHRARPRRRQFPSRRDQPRPRQCPDRAASPSSRSAPPRRPAASASPIARSASKCRAFDASTIAITPNRSARATAAATAERNTPSTGRSRRPRAPPRSRDPRRRR